MQVMSVSLVYTFPLAEHAYLVLETSLDIDVIPSTITLSMWDE